MILVLNIFDFKCLDVLKIIKKKFIFTILLLYPHNYAFFGFFMYCKKEKSSNRTPAAAAGFYVKLGHDIFSVKTAHANFDNQWPLGGPFRHTVQSFSKDVSMHYIPEK